MRRAWLVAAVACACDRAPPISTCSDDLAGVYAVERGMIGDAPGDAPREVERWHLLDNRGTLEAYPMFDDTRSPPAGLEIAPRVLDLRRAPGGLAGEVSRSYMQGTERCVSKARARVVDCHDDTLEVVLADPVPPIAFAPCAYGQAASSRRERWRR